MSGSARQVGGFLLRAGAVYALLALPGNPLEAVHAALYRAAANQIAAGLPLEHDVWLREDPSAEVNRDSSFLSRDRASGHVARRSFSVRHCAWIGTVLVAALAVGTPVAWRKRSIGALLGLLAHQGYLGVQVSAYLLLTYGGSGFHGGWRPLLDAFALTPWYLAPLLAWWLCIGRLLAEDRLPGRERETAGPVPGSRRAEGYLQAGRPWPRCAPGRPGTRR